MMSEAPSWMRKKWNIMVMFIQPGSSNWTCYTEEDCLEASPEEAVAAFENFKAKLLSIQTAIANGRGSDPLVLYIRSHLGERCPTGNSSIGNRADECIIPRHLMETSFIRLQLQEITP